MNVLAPEEIELNKKRRVLERLKDKLADREEEMTELRAELDQFEARYTMEVARFYAELDEIEAQIAEEEVKLVPDDEEIKKRAEELRKRAEESAANAEARGRLHAEMATDHGSEKGLSQLSKNHSSRSRFGRRRKGKTPRIDGKTQRRVFGGRSESSEQTGRRFPRFARSHSRRFDRRRTRAGDSADLADQKPLQGIKRRKARLPNFPSSSCCAKRSKQKCAKAEICSSRWRNARKPTSKKANGVWRICGI